MLSNKKWRLTGVVDYEGETNHGIFDTPELAMQYAKDSCGFSREHSEWVKDSIGDYTRYDGMVTYYIESLVVNIVEPADGIVLDLEELIKRASRSPENWDTLSEDFQKQLIKEVKERLIGFLAEHAVMVAFYGIEASGAIAKAALLEEDDDK